MKTKLAVALAVSLAMGVSGAAAQSQGRSHIGPQIGYNFDAEVLVVGAQFSAAIGKHLEAYPSFNYFFVDAGTLWAINADLKYRLPIQNADWLYVGAGLNITRFSVSSFSSTDAGLNLIGGVESRAGTIHPFGEFRLTVGDGSTIAVMGGLNITLGDHHRRR
jgi:hypothetical protein